MKRNDRFGIIVLILSLAAWGSAGCQSECEDRECMQTETQQAVGTSSDKDQDGDEGQDEDEDHDEDEDENEDEDRDVDERQNQARDAAVPLDAAGGGVDVRVDPKAPSDGTAKDAGGVTPKPAPGGGAALPSAVLDLSLWKLTVPVDTSHAGKPDEYLNPELKTLRLPPYFTVNPEGNGVIFQAHAGGATTGGSSYPRSELREMKGDGSQEADWSMRAGRHTLHVREAITHTPTVKPHVVAAQIHDAEDDVVMVRLEGKNLFVEGGGKSLGVLDANYQLGSVFTIDIVAANGEISVSYNGERKVSLPSQATGCYFKAGSYTQSNTKRGDKPDAYGQVIIYELALTHEP